MSRAAASGLGRSAPDNARFSSSTRACNHRRQLVEARRLTRDLPHDPQEAPRAQTTRWGRPPGARTAPLPFLLRGRRRQSPEMNMVGSPAGSCANTTGAQCTVRRPAPGKSIGLPLRMSSPGSKEGHGCDEQARLLARTSPAEQGHVENVDACNERRSGADKACANAGGG